METLDLDKTGRNVAGQDVVLLGFFFFKRERFETLEGLAEGGEAVGLEVTPPAFLVGAPICPTSVTSFVPLWLGLRLLPVGIGPLRVLEA